MGRRALKRRPNLTKTHDNHSRAVQGNDLLQPIRQQYGGNMRRFDGLYERGGKKVYIIDWVTGRGELVTFTIDARSGRVISKS